MKSRDIITQKRNVRERNQDTVEGAPGVSVMPPAVDRCAGWGNDDRGCEAVGGHPVAAVGAHRGQHRPGIQVCFLFLQPGKTSVLNVTFMHQEAAGWKGRILAERP